MTFGTSVPTAFKIAACFIEAIEKPPRKEVMTENAPLPEIVFDAFAKVDLRCGTITKAERIPKSDKLLKLEVNLGELGQRQIVAGIGKSYEPEGAVGLRVIVVANLVKKDVFGVTSHGMVLATKTEEGKLMLPYCAGPDGARLS